MYAAYTETICSEILFIITPRITTKSGSGVPPIESQNIYYFPIRVLIIFIIIIH